MHYDIIEYQYPTSEPVFCKSTNTYKISSQAQLELKIQSSLWYARILVLGDSCIGHEAPKESTGFLHGLDNIASSTFDLILT